MPLVLGGTAKKVVALSTGLADFEATRAWNLAAGAPYAISKAALVMAVAKFSARYAEQGVLFLSVTPGVVMTGQFDGGLWLLLLLLLVLLPFIVLILFFL